MNSRNLTAQEQRRLEAALRHTQDARQYRRTLAILEYSRGKGVVEIARMLRVTRQSVYNWIVKFAPSHDLAQLADAPRCGRPARCRQQHQPLLDQLLQCRPDELGYWATQWTVPLLQEQLWHSTGEKYSEATLRHPGKGKPLGMMRTNKNQEKETPMTSTQILPSSGRTRRTAAAAVAGLALCA